MGNPSSVRVGILGTGTIARHHVDALRRIPGAIPTAVASASQDRAREFARQVNLPQAYGTHEEVLGNPDIEVVHICTRNALHFQLNALALEAGKHVVSEKPLALSSRDSTVLLNAAAKHSAVHACNYNYRAYPMVQQARHLAQSGVLGEIYLIHGSYTQDWLLLATDYDWRLDPKQAGPSGAMADIGTHWFDLAEHVTGLRVVRLRADLRTSVKDRIEIRNGGNRRHTISSDDCASVTFRMNNDALGSVVVSQVSAGRKNHLTLEISGSKGAVAWSQESPDVLWIGSREGPNGWHMRDTSMARDLPLPPGHPFGWRDGLERNLASIYSKINDPGSAAPVPFATFVDGHRAMVLLDAAIRSSAVGADIELPREEGDRIAQSVESRRRVHVSDGMEEAKAE